jgi:tetrahydromethanopterin S-methyltransferase subunit B
MAVAKEDLAATNLTSMVSLDTDKPPEASMVNLEASTDSLEASMDSLEASMDSLEATMDNSLEASSTSRLDVSTGSTPAASLGVSTKDVTDNSPADLKIVTVISLLGEVALRTVNADSVESVDSVMLTDSEVLVAPTDPILAMVDSMAVSKDANRPTFETATVNDRDATSGNFGSLFLFVFFEYLLTFAFNISVFGKNGVPAATT